MAQSDGGGAALEGGGLEHDVDSRVLAVRDDAAREFREQGAAERGAGGAAIVDDIDRELARMT